jgi:hypothetical protein
MSRYHDYVVSRQIAAQDHPFYALLMAAMRKADSVNTELLKKAWPEVYNELQARYSAPGGLLPEDRELFRDVGREKR